MIPFYAGADWSGKPDEVGDTFIFCVVALSDAEVWEETCLRVRQKLGMSQRQEFHGHIMKTDVRVLELLQAGYDMGMRVGAFISTVQAVTAGNLFLTREGVALEVLEQFLPICPLQTFWFDKGDLKGKNAEKAFGTEVCRRNRAIHPDSTLEANCRKSNSSSLIQLADVMAYAFRTQARGKMKDLKLKSLLNAIGRDERNLIIRS